MEPGSPQRRTRPSAGTTLFLSGLLHRSTSQDFGSDSGLSAHRLLQKAVQHVRRDGVRSAKTKEGGVYRLLGSHRMITFSLRRWNPSSAVAHQNVVMSAVFPHVLSCSYAFFFDSPNRSSSTPVHAFNATFSPSSAKAPPAHLTFPLSSTKYVYPTCLLWYPNASFSSSIFWLLNRYVLCSSSGI